MLLFRFNLLPALILCILSMNSYAQFTELQSLGDEGYSIHYASNGVVWIGGDGNTWKSTDYGDNFEFLPSTAQTGWGNNIWGTADGIYGLSSTQAFQVGYFFLPNDAIIFETATGNGNWEIAYSDNQNFEPERWTSDIDKGEGGNFVVVGSQGRVIISSDYGANWTLANSGTFTHFFQVEHIQGSNWIATDGNSMRKSSNNGASWSDASFPGSYSPFISSAAGVVYAGGQNTLYKSSDNGLSWQSMPETPFEILSLQTLSDSKVIAGSYDDLYVTYDSGLSWESYQIPNYNQINHMSFYDADNGIAIGENGYIIKTSNGGGPSYPLADFAVEYNYGCVDSMFHFTNETIGDYTYEWLVNGVVVSTSQNLDFAFPTTGAQEVTLRAFNQNGSGEKSINVATYPIPYFELPNLTISPDTVCPNATFFVTIENPVPGVIYKAINNGVLLSTPHQSLNGIPIEIDLQANSTGIGPQFHHFGIQASNTNLCSTHIEYVYDSILVMRPDPATEMYVPYDTICSGEHPSNLYFQVFNSQEDFSYRWTWNGSNGSDYVPGNGDTLTYDYGTVSCCQHTFTMSARHNDLYCVYPNMGSQLVITVFEEDETPASASQILAGESINFDHTMDYTHYTWDLSKLTPDLPSYLPVPPPFTYTEAGRDTVTMYGQMDSNNACNVTLQQIVDVIDTTGFGSYSQCGSGSFEMGKVEDYYLSSENIGYTISTKYYGSEKRMVIKKYDAAGEVLLNVVQPTSGSSNIDATTGIIADDDGNMYLTFVTTANSSLLWNTPFNYKYGLAKLSPDGDLIWLVGSSNAYWGKPALSNGMLVLSGFSTAGISIEQANGDVYSTTTNSNLPTGGKGFIVTLDTDGMVMRHSHFGNILTISTFNSFANVNFFSTLPSPPLVCNAPDGTVLISGLMQARNENQYVFMDSVYMQSEMFNSAQGINPQVYTMRYSPTGGVIEAFSPLRGYIDKLYDVACLDNGNIVYSGVIRNFFDTRDEYIDLKTFNMQNNAVGDYVSYLQCTDASGHNQWQLFNQLSVYHTLDAFGNSELCALGGYGNRGTWLGTEGLMYGANAIGSSDCVCATFNAAGEMTNAVNIASNGADVPVAMQVDACGNPRVFYATDLNGYDFPFTANWNEDVVTAFGIYDFGNCSAECIESSGIVFRDISIEAITLDTTDPYASNTRQVFADFSNYGNEALTSLSLIYELDGIISDTLELILEIPADSALTNQQILQHTFSNSIGHKVKLWINEVNGYPDSNTANDTLTYGFVICNGPLNGSYTVGQDNGIFNSISLAAFAVDTCGVSGPVEFLIANGIYEEAINFRPGNGQSTLNTVTYKSASGNASDVNIIPPTNLASNIALIYLRENCRFIQFENLSFSRTNAATAGTLININASCSDIGIHGCSFTGAELVNVETLMNITNTTDRIEISDNTFTGGSHGIRFGHPGSIYSHYGEDVVIARNQFLNQSRRSMDIFRTDGLIVDGNTFSEKMPKEVAFLLSQSNENFAFINNKIQLSNYSWPFVIVSETGNNIATSDLAKVLIFQNNFPVDGERALIANTLFNPGLTGNQTTLHINGCENIDIWHNTLNCQIEVTVSSGITFHNNLVTLHGGNNFMQVSSGNFSACDYNQYDNQFGTNVFNNKFFTCYPNCSLPLSFTEWQTNTGFDLNSVMDSAVYISSQNGHLVSQPHYGNLSVAAALPLDVDGEPRNLTTPAIGADEPMNIPFLVHLDQLVHPTCEDPNGGSIFVSAIGGVAPFTYSWNDGNTSSQRTNLVGGEYSVTITDANDLETTAQYNLNAPGSISIDIAFNPFCNGTSGQLTSTATGNYVTPINYLWSNGSASMNQTVSVNGSYSLSVTDANGCTAQSDTIEVNLGLFAVVPDTIMQTTCSGIGGIYMNTEFPVGNTIYVWNFGEYTTEDLEDVEPGEYNLMAVSGNGCVSLYTIELGEIMELELIVDTTCFNGTNGMLTAEVSGGVEPFGYAWSSGQNTPQVTDLTMGSYTVNVTDASGCTLSQSYEFGTPLCGCTGDVNNNGIIDIADMLDLIGSFGCVGSCLSDLDNDGIVGFTDIMMIIPLIGTTCE